jgi:hypothetical protein
LKKTLINKAIRYAKLSKDSKLWPGNTEAWFEYLNNTKRLQKINFNKVYPNGTLLLQDFNPKD